jgi:hypothetical protein
MDGNRMKYSSSKGTNYESMRAMNVWSSRVPTSADPSWHQLPQVGSSVAWHCSVPHSWAAATARNITFISSGAAPILNQTASNNNPWGKWSCRLLLVARNRFSLINFHRWGWHGLTALTMSHRTPCYRMTNKSRDRL